jgi:hypothetical protein
LVVIVGFPIERVVQDVIGYDEVIRVIPDDMFVVISLPDRLAMRTAQFIDMSGGKRFEGAHDFG